MERGPTRLTGRTLEGREPAAQGEELCNKAARGGHLLEKPLKPQCFPHLVEGERVVSGKPAQFQRKDPTAPKTAQLDEATGKLRVDKPHPRTCSELPVLV